MKIGRIWLCFPDGDRIIVDRLQDLEKYNLPKASGIDVVLSLNPEEFRALREKIEKDLPL